MLWLLRRFKKHARENPILVYGVPFLTFMVLGTHALTYFTRIRYENHDRRVRTLTKREERQLESEDKMRELKQEFEQMLKETDAPDDFEQKRIVRPWEEQK